MNFKTCVDPRDFFAQGLSSGEHFCPQVQTLRRRGQPINADNLAKRFKSILKEAGLPLLRLYDLRHTAATIALAAGVSPKVVSEQLGHASTAFTLDTYAHVLPHMQDGGCRKNRGSALWKGGVTDN